MGFISKGAQPPTETPSLPSVHRSCWLIHTAIRRSAEVKIWGKIVRVKGWWQDLGKMMWLMVELVGLLVGLVWLMCVCVLKACFRNTMNLFWLDFFWRELGGNSKSMASMVEKNRNKHAQRIVSGFSCGDEVSHSKKMICGLFHQSSTMVLAWHQAKNQCTSNGKCLTMIIQHSPRGGVCCLVKPLPSIRQPLEGPGTF